MQSYGVGDGNDDDGGGILLEVLLVEAKARNTDVAGDRLESAFKRGAARSHSDDDFVDNVGESEDCDDDIVDNVGESEDCDEDCLEHALRGGAARSHSDKWREIHLRWDKNTNRDIQSNLTVT